MNRLAVLSTPSAAIMAITLAFGHFTATPVSAQGQGQGGRPATDVNVINTPSVNVANTPTVNVGNTVPVEIQNAGKEKVYIRLNASSNTNTGSTPLDESYTVPAGKRLVITQISMEGNVPLQDRLIYARLFADTEVQSLDFSDARPTSVTNHYSGNHNYEWILNTGQVLSGSFTRTALVANQGSVDFLIVGYLEDAP